MRLKKLVIVACAIFLLLAAPVAASQGEGPGQISPSNEWTQTVDDNTVTITFTVNTSGKKALANTTVNITNHSSELQIVSNKTQEVGRIKGGEQRQVSYEIQVPEGVEKGNYTVTANLTRRGRFLDSANYTVWVNYNDGGSGSVQGGSDSSDDEKADETSKSQSGGGVGVVAAGGSSCEPWWSPSCIKQKIGSYFDEIPPDWLSDLLE